MCKRVCARHITCFIPFFSDLGLPLPASACRPCCLNPCLYRYPAHRRMQEMMKQRKEEMEKKKVDAPAAPAPKPKAPTVQMLRGAKLAMAPKVGSLFVGCV